MIGSGVRRSKLLVPGRLLADLPGAEVRGGPRPLSPRVSRSHAAERQPRHDPRMGRGSPRSSVGSAERWASAGCSPSAPFPVPFHPAFLPLVAGHARRLDRDPHRRARQRSLRRCRWVRASGWPSASPSSGCCCRCRSSPGPSWRWADASCRRCWPWPRCCVLVGVGGHGRRRRRGSPCCRRRTSPTWATQAVGGRVALGAAATCGRTASRRSTSAAARCVLPADLDVDHGARPARPLRRRPRCGNAARGAGDGGRGRVVVTADQAAQLRTAARDALPGDATLEDVEGRSGRSPGPDDSRRTTPSSSTPCRRPDPRRAPRRRPVGGHGRRPHRHHRSGVDRPPRADAQRLLLGLAHVGERVGRRVRPGSGADGGAGPPRPPPPLRRRASRSTPGPAPRCSPPSTWSGARSPTGTPASSGCAPRH